MSEDSARIEGIAGPPPPPPARPPGRARRAGAGEPLRRKRGIPQMGTVYRGECAEPCGRPV